MCSSYFDILQFLLFHLSVPYFFVVVYVKLPSSISTIPLKDEEENEDDDDIVNEVEPLAVNGENTKNNQENTNLRRSIRQSLRQMKKKQEYPRIIIKPIPPPPQPPKEGNY